MKNTIKGIIIGVVLTSIISVSAAYVYTAKDIGYTPSDENWNVTDVNSAINDIKTDINNINNLVEQGDMLYPAGSINLVANVSDDSFYVDENGKFVIAESTTGTNLLTNSNYKSIASTSDTKGEVGSDLVTKVSSGHGTIFTDYKFYTSAFNYSYTAPKNGFAYVDLSYWENTSVTVTGLSNKGWLYTSQPAMYRAYGDVKAGDVIAINSSIGKNYARAHLMFVFVPED